MIASNRRKPLAAALLSLGFLSFSPLGATAEDKVVATVDGKPITETDLKFADLEIGSDFGNLPPATKRRVLVEYMIENQLFADAAERDKLGAGSAFDQRLAYWRRRALRDTYFDATVKGGVSEAVAKSFYEDRIKGMKPEEEVQVRHILVDTEEKAKEIADRLAKGEDFAKLAKEFSKDPGSKDEGGMLGFYGHGHMVPPFEEAMFRLKNGEVSQPVKSQFGYHLIKVEDRREKKVQTFEEVKEQILNGMIQRKAQEVAGDLRTKAKIEYIDPEVKKLAEEQEKTQAEQKKAMEAQIKAQIDKMEKDKGAAPAPAEEKK